jgi:hypothetical protein
MNIVSSDINVSIAPWPLIARGQTYSLKIEGQNADGSPYQLVIDTDRALTDEEVSSGPKRAVDRLNLENLRDSSDFTLIFGVRFTPAMSGTTFPASVFRIVQKKYDPLILSGPSSAHPGDRFKFSATGGQPPYAYLSSNAAVARMTDAVGNGVAVGSGNCAISVTDNAMGSAVRNFRVVVENPNLYVTPSNYVNVKPGQTYTFTALTGTPPFRWSGGARPEEVQLHNTSGSSVTLTTTSRFKDGTDIVMTDALGRNGFGVLYPAS